MAEPPPDFFQVPKNITGDPTEIKKKEKTPAKKRPPVKREKVKDNEIIKSDAFTWKVIKILGSGGFGDVYRVQKENNDDKRQFAMKTEMVEGDKRMLRLKIEVTVLKQCHDQPPANRKHFVEFVDRGITDKFKFLVMGLVGPSLEDIRKQYLLRSYSKSTALQAAMQTLRGLQDLHAIGWLHRDIKPANYAVGLEEFEGVVYLLDFGIARKIFTGETREVKTPRAKVKFLGTLRFAARACHNCVDQGRKDDVETWLYMVYDLLDETHGLPWKRAANKDQIITYKSKFFKHAYPKVYRIIPKEFQRLVEYIDQLKYEDEPDYKFIHDSIVAVANQNKIPLDKKLDWIGKLKKKPDGKSGKPEEDSGSSDNKQSGSDSDTTKHQQPSRNSTKPGQGGHAPTVGEPTEIKKKDPNRQKNAKKKKPVKREIMKSNMVVKSDSFTWKVIKLLGSGGFGDVYRVQKEQNEDKRQFAMKTEMVEGDKRMLRLKIEVTVLKQCHDQPPANRKHFVEFVDRGITDKFKFLVMGLVGPSLEDIRKQYLLKNFNKSTALQTSIQTLKGLQDLHTIGWLHRDIKPANYAVGLEETEGIVYLLDFGIARKIFAGDTKEVKTPRAKVKFLGTMRFAARACHKCVDQGRKDDLETWLYMVFDLFDEVNGLPWKRAADKNEIINYKSKFFKHAYPKAYKIVPKEFQRLVEYIDQLKYEDEPDYKYLNDAMVAIAKENRISLDKKLEWLGKLKKKEDLKQGKPQEDDTTSSDNKQSGSDSESEARKKTCRKQASTRHKK